MCGRFVLLTYDEVAEVVRSIEFSCPVNFDPDWPAVRRDAFPGTAADVIVPRRDGVSGEGGLTLGLARLAWGYKVPWARSAVINARIESAHAGRGMWARSFACGRCVVPTAGFFEPHATERSRSERTGALVKRPYRFTTADEPATLLAGVCENGRFSVVTTQPNSIVSPIHDRMPLVLRFDEVAVWLGEDFCSLADRSAVVLRAEPALPLADDGQLRLF